MGLFSKIGHFIGHVAKAGLDVVEGNPTAAVGQLALSTGLIPTGGSKPKLVKTTGGAYPGVMSGVVSTNSFSSAVPGGLPVTVTNVPSSSIGPVTTLPTPSLGGNFSGFLTWLKNRGSVSDYISLLYDFITKPFSSWPTHLQDLYQQYQQSLQTGSGGTGGSTLPATTLPGLQPVLTPQTHTTIKRAPKGYVTVEYPPDSGKKVWMRKELARSLKLWKSRKKPPISVRDWESAKRYKSVQKKLETVAKDVDLKTEKPTHRRRTTSRTAKTSAVPAQFEIIKQD